ncbi:MAG: autotransporter domain-containing protein [Phycisphaerales bacterium]
MPDRPLTFPVTLAAILGLLPAGMAAADLTWDGGNGDGDFSSPANWGGTNPDADGDGALDDPDLVFSGAVQTTVLVDDDYTNIDSIVFDSSSDTFTINGDGDANVESFIFNDGAMITNDSTQAGDVTFGAGLELVFSGDSASITNNDANGDSSIIIDSAIDMAGDGDFVLTLNGAGDFEIGGVISGAGASLDWDGSGTLMLTAINTYTGGTTLGGGTVLIGDGDAFGTGQVRIDGDTNFGGTGGAITGLDNDFAIVSGSTLTFSGSEDVAFEGRLLGSGAVIVDMDTAGDELALNGQSTGYTGVLTLRQGSVVASDDFSLGTRQVVVDGTDGDISLAASVADLQFRNDFLIDDGSSTAVLDVVGANGFEISGDLTGDGDVEVGLDSGEFLTLSGNNADFEGDVIIDNAGAGVIAGSDTAFGSGSLTLETDGALGAAADDTVVANDIVLGANTLTVDSDSDIAITGVISGTGGVEIDSADSEVTISGTNTHTGTTTLTDGTLLITTEDALGDAGGGATLALDGGSLGTLSQDLEVDHDVTVGGDVTFIDNQGGSLALNGLMDLGNADRTLTVEDGAGLTIGGVISSTGQDDALTKDGDGALILGADNSAWNGGVILAGGSLGVADDDALGGGTLSVSADDVTLFASGDGRTIANAVDLQDSALILGGSEDLSLSGAITESGGTGSLVINSTADVSLSNAGNTFTGGTTILAGDVSFGADNALGLGTLTLTGGSLGSLSNGLDISEDVVVDGGFTIGGNNDFEFSGGISGDGQLTIDFAAAADALTLSGTNTFATDVMIETGTVQVTGGSAFGDSAAAIFGGTGDGSLVLLGNETLAGLGGGAAGDAVVLGANTLTLGGDGDDVFAYAGNISGTGGLAVTGGTQYLNADMTYTGTTTISGGTLGGTGSVDGDVSVASGGTFAPGGASTTGSFGIDGNLNVASGGTLAISINGSDLSMFDSVAATGTANLASGSAIAVDVSSQAGGYIVSNSAFEILAADGGITAGDIDVMTDSATLDFYGLEGFDIDGDFVDGETALSIVATRAANAFSNPDVVSAGNNRAVGAALDSLIVVADAAGGSGDAADLLAQLQGLDAAELNDALNEIAPVAAATPSAIASSGVTRYSGVQSGYLAARRDGTDGLFMAASTFDNGTLTSTSYDPQLLAQVIGLQEQADDTSSAFAGDSDRFHLWAKVYGFQSDLDAEGNRSGFEGDFFGAQFGMDWRFGENLIAGVGFGYLETDADLLPSRGDIDADTYRIGPYASWDGGDWFVDASLTFGLTDYDQNRFVRISGQADRTANGDYDGTDLTAYIGGGREFDLARGWTITPTASLRYSMFDYDAYDETGAGSFNTRILDRDQDSLQSRLGVTFGRRFTGRRLSILPELSIGWEHEFSDYDDVEAAFVVGGDPFSVDVGTPVSDAMFVGLGVTLMFDSRMSGYVKYDGLFGSGADTHGVTGGLSLRF